MDEKKKINEYNIEIKKLSDLPKDDLLASAEEVEIAANKVVEDKQVLF